MGAVAEEERAAASERRGSGTTSAALALLAIAGGVVAAFGLFQLLHRANDPMRRVNRLLDLCYRGISNLEATLGRDELSRRELAAPGLPESNS